MPRKRKIVVAPQKPVRPHAPARLNFDEPLAPQFRIETTTVRRLREFKRWKPGSYLLEFRDITLPRVRFIERGDPCDE